MMKMIDKKLAMFLFMMTACSLFLFSPKAWGGEQVMVKGKTITQGTLARFIPLPNGHFLSSLALNEGQSGAGLPDDALFILDLETKVFSRVEDNYFTEPEQLQFTRRFYLYHQYREDLNYPLEQEQLMMQFPLYHPVNTDPLGPVNDIFIFFGTSSMLQFKDALDPPGTLIFIEAEKIVMPGGEGPPPNHPPEVHAGLDAAVTEGTAMRFNGSFTDRNVTDSHTIEWDFGDNSPRVSGTLIPSHIYADNGVYTVSLTVTDNQLGLAKDTSTILVSNVAPTVTAGPDQTVNAGEMLVLNPHFVDKGTLDTHTCTIDWGDASPLETAVCNESPFGPPGNISGVAGDFTGSHVYVLDGTYTIKACVDDDDAASTCGLLHVRDRDGNQDGIPDSQQVNVATLQDSASTSYVTFASPAGTQVRNVRAMGNPSPASMPQGASFRLGFFDFALEGLIPGASTTVTLFLPPGVAMNSYYKYGPTPDNPLPHWYEFLFDGQTGAEIKRDRVILHFVDGKRGDDDLIANGVIVSPGGAAFQTPPLHLFPGINLISIPIDSATLPDAFTLLPILGDASEIERVHLLDGAGHIKEARFNTTGNPSGDNFLLEGGVGLIVYSQVEKTLRLPGINSCPTRTLTTGRNLSGVSCPFVDLRAFELLQVMSGTVVTSIQRFNGETGRFETAAYQDGIPAGVDFPIVASEGYLITLK